MEAKSNINVLCARHHCTKFDPSDYTYKQRVCVCVFCFGVAMATWVMAQLRGTEHKQRIGENGQTRQRARHPSAKQQQQQHIYTFYPERMNIRAV